MNARRSPPLNDLLDAIVEDDRRKVLSLLKSHSDWVTRLIPEAKLHDAGIFHWIYVGDTPLHLASAGYRVEIVEILLQAGADPNAAKNHRKSTPLHYASDGFVTGPAWNADRQVATIRRLLEAGACIEAADKNGATPLHRAVRTRSALAVQCLLEAGANPVSRNLPGSTPFHLAVQNTGRGGSGESVAKDAQREIIKTFLACGVSPGFKDSNGKTVIDCCQSAWTKEMLATL